MAGVDVAEVSPGYKLGWVNSELRSKFLESSSQVSPRVTFLQPMLCVFVNEFVGISNEGTTSHQVGAMFQTHEI